MRSNTSLYIGRIVSAYLIVTGAGFFLSGPYFSQLVSTTQSDPVLINLSGMTHFLVGAAILVFHFKWRSVLEVMVSLIGCAYYMKGTMLIALPELTLQTGNNEMQASLVLPGIGFLAYGFVLAYLAFVRNRLSHNDSRTAA